MQDRDHFSLKEALRAEATFAVQRFTIFLPNKDRHKNKIDIESYIEAGMHLLADINLGVTRLPTARGVWIDEDLAMQAERDGRKLALRDYDPEDTVVIFAYLKRPQVFEDRIGEIKEFLHDFGRRTDQGEVLVEFFGERLDDPGGFHFRVYSIKPPYDAEIP